MGISGRAVFFIIQFLFGLACLVVGAIFVNDCPIERMIPIFLIVSGSTNILLVLLAVLQSIYYDEEAESGLSCWRVIIILFTLFWTAWFIAGSYWIYTNYQPQYRPASNERHRYCDKGLYLFSFWVINLTYMFFGVFLIAVAIIYICMPEIWNQMWGY